MIDARFFAGFGVKTLTSKASVMSILLITCMKRYTGLSPKSVGQVQEAGMSATATATADIGWGATSVF